jgi:hypothetical protein
VQHIAGWYTSCGMFFPEGSGPTKRDRLGPAQLLNNLSLTPQQNPGGMVYPPTPPIPLPFCEGNPYPCQGVGVLEGKGKGKDLIPWGYPCHSLVRSQNQVALCVASSGIASLLLEGGRTAHSTFKIPIPITDTSTAGVKKNSQGQSVHTVGLNLQTHVFSHGQLYVAFSRCTSGSRIRVLLQEGDESKKVPNVVYKEVLQGLNL